MRSLKSLLKGIGAAVMAIAMAVALLPTAAMADTTTYTLTLTGTKTGHTYQVYQIFTGDLSGSGNSRTLSNVKWGAGVTPKDSTLTAETAAQALENTSDTSITIENLAGQLNLTTQFGSDITSTEGSTVISGLPAGYYLVKDKDGTQNNATDDSYTDYVIQVVGDTSTKIKSNVPTVEKKVKDNTTTNGLLTGWQDSADYSKGDWIPYKITGTMPADISQYSSYYYKSKDTMSAGLTFSHGDDADHKAKVEIDGTDVTSSFTQNVTSNTDGTTTVTWTCDDLKGISGVTPTANSTVVVYYYAQLNEQSVIGAAGNPNTVNLTYSNNPNNGGSGDTGHTPDDKNIVFTYTFTVNKTDAKTGNPLAGAGFTLYKVASDGTETEFRTFTAGTETAFAFDHLDAGDYKLVESTTPAGYNTMTPVTFSITAGHDQTSDNPKLTSLEVSQVWGNTTQPNIDKTKGTIDVTIANGQGSILPSTGGMGTTILYVGGAAIAIAAGLGIHFLRRRSNNA